jgi:hypothetical protein
MFLLPRFLLFFFLLSPTFFLAAEALCCLSCRDASEHRTPHSRSSVVFLTFASSVPSESTDESAYERGCDALFVEPVPRP